MIKQLNMHSQHIIIILLQYYNRTMGNNISVGKVVQRSNLGHELHICSVTVSCQEFSSFPSAR